MIKKIILSILYLCLLNACQTPPQSKNPNSIAIQQSYMQQPQPINKGSPKIKLNDISKKQFNSNDRIEESKKNGIVSQIKIKNRNNFPDYYLYPEIQNQLQINNPPNVISPVMFEIRW